MSDSLYMGEPRLSATSSRGVRWVLGVGAAFMAAIGLVLLFLLTQATDNRELYERYYTRIFVLNVVVALALLGVIGWMALRLYRRFRSGRFGSRLLVKLAAVFALAGFAPGVLIYVVSYQFVSRSIESWFDVKVEGALEAGLGLGRATIDALAADLSAKTRTAALQLGDVPDVTVVVVLDKLREQLGVNDATVWGPAGKLIAGAGRSQMKINPQRPTTQQLRLARERRIMTWIEGLDEPGAKTSTQRASVIALAAVPGPSLGALGELRYLMVSQELPVSLVANAQAVAEAYSEYQQRALARGGLKRMYIGTLTLSLFLAVFSAVLLAVLLGNQITRPLLLLAHGVRQVAAGDLTPKAVLLGRDELGGLTRSFAQMTQQLADARSAVERSMDEVDAARDNLQTILDNLTAGVIVTGADGTIQSVNPGAARILGHGESECLGHRLEEIAGLEHFGAGVRRQFEIFQGEQAEHGQDHWQQTFELADAADEDDIRKDKEVTALMVRGAELPGQALLLVFDDISDIVSAQRAQAWGEVARRLAHEIKNPLTPIQLAAERLERKLANKLPEAEQTVVSKSVKTIVDQVDAMKRLVNEFRDYARLPTAELKPLDLNQVVNEVLQLYGSRPGGLPLQHELDPRCPRIQGDAQQLRQVLHNLLQNAQDAMDNAPAEARELGLLVRTQWVESSSRVRLSVMDHGPGFPDSILKRAFEPYVTTKDKGTGLGLAVVKKIADEHGARVDLSNRQHEGQIRGAQVSLSFAIDPAQETTGRTELPKGHGT